MSLNTTLQRLSFQSAVRLRVQSPSLLSLPEFHHRSFGSLSHSWSHFSFHDNREERKVNVVPKISLPYEQHSLTLPTRRFHSTSQPMSASSTRNSTKTDKEQVVAKQGKKKAQPSFTELFTKYGSVFVGIHASVYLMTLGLLFVGVESGALDPAYAMTWVSQADDPKPAIQFVTETMEKYSWTREYAPMVAAHPSLANFGFAWILVKFTEPIRLPITMAILPNVVKYTGGDQESNEDDNKASEASSTELDETKKR